MEHLQTLFMQGVGPLQICAISVVWIAAATLLLDLEDDDDLSEMGMLLPRRRKRRVWGECDICYEMTSQMGYVLSCGHKTFCYDCLAGIEKAVCPLCRAPVRLIKTFD